MESRGSTRALRALLVATLALLATIGLAGTAFAHATLIGSDPADGATLQTAPTIVTLTFDDSLEDFEPVVTVTGPDGNQYQSGSAVIDGVTMSSAVQPLTAAGAYTIAYRVVSDDGHPVEGQVRFDLAAAAVQGTTPTTPTSPTAPIGPSATAGVSPTSAATTSGAGPGPGSATPSAATSPSGVPTTNAGAAAADSSNGWSAWQWLIVALFVFLAFGASMIIRRRLETRARADRSPGPDD